MKYLYKLLPILCVAVLLSCDGNGGGGSDPTPELTALEKIQGTWNLSSVSRDGGDVSTEFAGFSINISDTNYTISNGGTAWADTSGSIVNLDAQSPASSFQVTFTNTTSVGVQMDLSNENKTLTLSFTVDNTSFGGGRTSGLAGSYEFVLNKN